MDLMRTRYEIALIRYLFEAKAVNDIDGDELAGIEQIMTALHDEVFFYEEIDINRISDALGLREILGFRDKIRSDPSTLEVLISLSDRMAFQTSQSRFSCFKQLLINIGIYHERDANIIHEKSWVMQNRFYSNDGSNGGLFPVPGDYKQKDRELWYQMMNYL